MADLFQLESTGDVSSGGSTGQPLYGQDLNTGVLRRKYNFGDRVSELQIAQDPFFRMVSKLAKKPTDDPEFKFTERRPSFHKRYAYPVAFSNDNTTWVETLDGTDIDTQLDSYETVATTVYVKMMSDYKHSGNLSSVFGNSGNEVKIGAEGTQPQFYLPGQMVRINFANASSSLSVKQKTASWAIMKVSTVTLQNESTNPPTAHGEGEAAILKGTVVKAKTAGHDVIAGVDSAAPAGDSTYNVSMSGEGESNGSGLEDYRSYVVGSAHAQGTGYPETG